MTHERSLAIIRERMRCGDYLISFTHTEKLRERKISFGDLLKGRYTTGRSSKTIPMTQEDRAASFSAGQVVGPFISCVVGLTNNGS